ncbi:MAG: hypothetical protein JWL98_622, partial [Xanthomonadaceae bacterium]|nr:hypothetical protein [Xanthomonadaceae bacterium]
GYPLQIQTHGQGRSASDTVTMHYSRFNDPTIRIDVP